jgi:hypothetical protein
MARLCTDAACRTTLSEGAIRHAARFSWERTADRTEAALHSIVEDRATDGSEHRDEHEG